MDSGKLSAARQRLLRGWIPEAKLYVSVVFTTAQGTKAALDAASKLAHGLNAKFAIFAFLMVPHRIPLDQPLVSPDHVRRQILSLLPGVVAEEDIRIEICMCRDPVDCLQELLAPGSLVFLGGRGFLRAWRERRLEKALSALGHEVIFVGQSGG